MVNRMSSRDDRVLRVINEMQRLFAERGITNCIVQKVGNCFISSGEFVIDGRTAFFTWRLWASSEYRITSEINRRVTSEFYVQGGRDFKTAAWFIVRDAMILHKENKLLTFEDEVLGV